MNHNTVCNVQIFGRCMCRGYKYWVRLILKEIVVPNNKLQAYYCEIEKHKK